MDWQCLAQLKDVSEDDALPVAMGDTLLALIRRGDEVFCVSNVCTHEFALLSDGIVEDGVIECPLHAARFDIATGERQSGPECPRLRTFPVRVVDGSVHIGRES